MIWCHLQNILHHFFNTCQYQRVLGLALQEGLEIIMQTLVFLNGIHEVGSNMSWMVVARIAFQPDDFPTEAIDSGMYCKTMRFQLVITETVKNYVKQLVNCYSVLQMKKLSLLWLQFHQF